ncbi:MAG: hypothetical protein LIP77_06440, partial [Planctomycetes bacterium]|nr:hypothetical protein [Planctomycetota bacterium]
LTLPYSLSTTTAFHMGNLHDTAGRGIAWPGFVPVRSDGRGSGKGAMGAALGGTGDLVMEGVVGSKEKQSACHQRIFFRPIGKILDKWRVTASDEHRVGTLAGRPLPFQQCRVFTGCNTGNDLKCRGTP